MQDVDDGDGWGPFITAAYAGRVEEVRRLLAAGADPNEKPRGVPVLTIAANMGRTRVVGVLIDSGAAVYAVNMWGEPALFFAVAPDIGGKGHLATVRALLRGGANADFRDSGGGTALMKVQNGAIPIMRLLLQSGASVNAVTTMGHSALTIAAWQGFPGNVRELLTAGADVELRTTEGKTALIYAAAGLPDPSGLPDKDPDAPDRIETVKRLLEAGADASVRDAEGLTAREHALSFDRVRIARLLETAA